MVGTFDAGSINEQTLDLGYHGPTSEKGAIEDLLP